ncbi:Hachiman antiphage defense system protein HamA [Erythrobacter dokdonensis]|uniref:Hachiman antiphage defense system protein HamA n=1 Tax=Erythrobacter dokdonensis TaxID=328225 RepID=UPI000839FB0A|nr:Hachiman antiphage defense system protein HamA [Erythrobacter dokdonensis]
MTTPDHLNWLVDTGERHATACGREIEIWEINPQEDAQIISLWARHLRQHYIADADLPFMAAGTGLAHPEYLRTILFPDAKVAPGPSLRSGDFGEILVADFIEYFRGFWCPRELRYQDRWNRNDSTKGCDVIGFKFAKQNDPGAADELFIFESKSGMSATKTNRLQDAINDSIRDRLREGMSLNAIKRRFFDRGEMDDARKVERFQNEADRPFHRVNGAAAILDEAVFAQTELASTDGTAHYNQDDLRLLVIRGPSLMKLVHALYERAADEA